MYNGLAVVLFNIVDNNLYRSLKPFAHWSAMSKMGIFDKKNRWYIGAKTRG